MFSVQTGAGLVQQISTLLKEFVEAVSNLLFKVVQ